MVSIADIKDLGLNIDKEEDKCHLVSLCGFADLISLYDTELAFHRKSFRLEINLVNCSSKSGIRLIKYKLAMLEIYHKRFLIRQMMKE